MQALTRSWRSLRDTFRVFARFGHAWLYPASSFLVTLVLMFTLVIPMFERVLATAKDSRFEHWAVLFLAVYLSYAALYLVTAFANVAWVTAVTARLDRERHGPRVALGRATGRIVWITAHTLVSATIGTLGFIIRIIVNPLFGMVIAPAIGKRLWERVQHLSYNVPLMMEIPVIALDRPPPRDAYRRGMALVESTWGDGARPAHGLGLPASLLLLALTAFVAMPIVRHALVVDDPRELWRGLAVMTLTTSTYLQLNGWTNTIFALGAYRYAAWDRSDLFPGDPTYAEHAFERRQERER